MINLSEKKEKGFISKNLTSYFFPKSKIAEEFRKTRTTLQFSSKNKECQSLLITSSGFGEGKTTCMINLGVSLAQLGKKVLIVDTDLRKPTLHKTFNCKTEEGLTSVLKGQARLEEVIGHTGIKTLDILPSGTIPQYPAELLSSSGMKRVMAQLNTFYEYILYDTPPLLEVTDTSILVNQCDGVLLVIGYGKVSYKKIREAKKVLELSGGKLLGSIFNRKPNR
jgi:protein-tyrosine kinase